MQANTKSLRPLARWVVGAILSLAACAPSNAAGPAMLDVSYSSGIVALDAATRTLSYGSVSGNVTNVLSAGESVYWQDGRNIYQAPPNLFGAQLQYTAPEGFTPTDFAIDPAAGMFYVSFSSGLLALDAATRTLNYGSVSGNVTNVLTSGGSVYWQDGRNIYRAQPNLFSAQLWYSAPEGFTPTDFAIDPAAGMLYVSFSSGLLAIDAATRTLNYGSVSGNVTNVLASGGSVYWQDGRNIYQARPNLFGAQLWYSAPEGFMPTDFTIAVPEPGTGWQLLAGGSALVWAALRRNRSRMKMSKVHGKEPEGLPTA